MPESLKGPDVGQSPPPKKRPKSSALSGDNANISSLHANTDLTVKFGEVWFGMVNRKPGLDFQR